MKRPPLFNRRPPPRQPGGFWFKLLFMLAAAGFCAAVFVASLFIASFAVFVLLGLAGTDRMSPGGVSAMLILGQFVTVLIAMAATYATFAGLRWVWRGFALR